MANNGNLVFLPGIMGSDLYYGPGGQQKLWVNPTALIDGAIVNLELNTDGITPIIAPPWGTIVPGTPLEEYYGPILQKLSDDWTVLQMGYDWRHSLLITAGRVLTRIRAEIGTADYYLVGHSMGGLVARLIWRLENIGGTAARIKRIACLATPHWGSYATTLLFSGNNDTYTLILRVLALGTLKNTGIGPKAGLRRISAVTSNRNPVLDRVVATWPSVYEIMPQLAQPGAAAFDSGRSTVYQLSTWTGTNPFVTQNRLDTARATQSDLNLTGVPPAALTVNVRSSLRGTPFRILTGEDPRKANSFDRNSDGDGVVTDASAARDDILACNLLLSPPHFEITNHWAVREKLTGWLLNGVSTGGIYASR